MVFSAFYNDLKSKGIPDEIQADFIELVRKLKDTITKMPMKYIGRSISNDLYSIFQYQNQLLRKPTHVDIEFLINNFRTFSIPLDYYEAFRILGSFINGRETF